MDTEKILYFCTSFTSTLVNAFSSPPTDVETILIVKLDEIGDMIYTLHCIEALANRHPDAKIDVYCKSMNNALVLQTNKVTNVYNSEKQLKKNYDVQVDFRGNWRTLKRVLLGKCRIYLDRGSIRLRNKFLGGQKHEIETNQETIQWMFPKDHSWEKPSLKVSKQDIDFTAQVLKKHSIDKFVIMHCGARDEARRWPTERFANLIDSVFELYQLKTVLVGSPNEKELNEKICSKSAHAINLAGETNLLQLAALMRSATFFVGNESGPLHFAIIENKPLVALFGPGVKNVFYPIYPNQKVIHHVSDKQSNDDKQSSIMKISQEEVLEAIGSLTL